MKDVPAQMPDGFVIAAVLPREDPRDALISHRGEHFADLPDSARVGTSSLRRQTQLLHRRGDLEIVPVRGNVDTRLGKVAAGDYDAIVLAAAGLRRLGWDDRITEYLPTEWCLPAAAQGAIGIECRADDAALRERLAGLEDRDCRIAIDIERAFCAALGASCTSPVAALAEVSARQVSARARVLSDDGATLLEAACSRPRAEHASIGAQLARDLTGRGALELLGQQ